MMTLLVDVAVATFNVRESLVSAWGVSVDSGLERFLNKGVELGLIEVSKKIGLKNNLTVFSGVGGRPFGCFKEFLMQGVSFSANLAD